MHLNVDEAAFFKYGDNIAGNFLAVDEHFFHATHYTVRVQYSDVVCCAPEAAGDGKLLPIRRDAGVYS